MRAFAYLVTFVAAAVLSSASPVTNDNIPVMVRCEQGDKCPAPVFENDYKNCTCFKDNISAACTKMICPPRISNNDRTVPVVLGYNHGDKCPAPFFKDDCNNCFCLEDGHSAACTRMLCSPRTPIPNGKGIRSFVGYNHGDKCPAPFFKDDCNNCFCLEDGHSAACTRMLCSSRSPSPNEPAIPVVCKQIKTV